jgi:hypothetical protein
MFERKRALKSNTRDLRIRNIGFEKVKKFEELLQRTGKDNEIDSFVVIIDLLDNELPAIKIGTEIPQSVIDWRKENGFEDENFGIVNEADEPWGDDFGKAGK